MLAEACHTNKPVGMFELRERARSRLNRKLRAITSVLASSTARLTARGLWVPARDMTELHRRAVISGLLSDPADLMSAAPRTGGPVGSFYEVRDRIRGLLDRQETD